MKQRKRQRKNEDDDNNNKRRKFQNPISIINSKKSLLTQFEDLSNELIYEIFDYLDMYQISQSFFDLNHRYEKLLDRNFPMKINIFSMSKSNFERYYSKIILPNKHRIISLRLTNLIHIDILLSPPLILSKFLRLETLILENIKSEHLENILKYALSLPNLSSLILNPIYSYEHSNHFYRQIFRLPVLKYCQLSFGTNSKPELLPLSDNEYSPIEHFVIKNTLYFDQFEIVLSYLPQLRKLSIDCLNGYFSKKMELSPIVFNYLTDVSLDFHHVYFNQFEILIKNYFHHIEVLRISTGYDIQYLNANRWEQLILSSMPNLRVFHMIHRDSMRQNNDDHQLSFLSSFWHERQCFVTHSKDSRGIIDIEIFYPKDLYRKKKFKLLKIESTMICPIREENNRDLVNDVHICDIKALNNCLNYFPNVTNLTLDYDFYTPDNAITINLNRILPLLHITKLIIESRYIRFTKLIEILGVIPNVSTLKISCPSIFDEEYTSIQQNESFKIVSNTNLIKNVIISGISTLKRVELLVALCLQLESLQTGMDRKTLNSIVQFILTKSNNYTRQLFFLCISNVPKLCLREVKRVIKLEKLLENYLIQFNSRHLYLWW